MCVLVVKSAFKDYQKGSDVIRDETDRSLKFLMVPRKSMWSRLDHRSAAGRMSEE